MIGVHNRVPRVNGDKCRACVKCQARSFCRLKALVQFEPSELPYVDHTLCRGCLVCMERCPYRAIETE